MQMRSRRNAGRSFLGNEIERVRDLEGHLGAAAGEIALLVADAGNDRVAAVLDIDALGGLVVGHARVRRDAAYVEMIRGDIGVAGGLQVAQRPFARLLMIMKNTSIGMQGVTLSVQRVDKCDAVVRSSSINLNS